ncbi:MAG TPA: hypothetical protein DDY98_05760 [Ruminococcaceae bacterium]|nr:hypothetical protein [Oscillospiraceae bacterium]
MSVYLGIEGGKAKTTAIAANEKGKILAKVEGECIDFNLVPLAKARKNLKNVLDVLAERVENQPFQAVAVSLTSLPGTAGKRDTASLCNGIIDCERILIDRDLFIAMQSIYQPGARAVVISGIGSSVAVEDENGKRTSFGSWGHLLGDEGSGYQISLSAIRYAIRAEQGMEPSTQLTHEIFDYFEVADFRELRALLEKTESDPKGISDFAGRVFRCANHGDAAAIGIVGAQAMLLAETVKTLLRDLPEDTTIGLWGGIFRYNRLFRNEFSMRLLEQSGSYQIQMLDYPPECGALFAAYKLCNVPITEEIIKNTDVYRGLRV